MANTASGDGCNSLCTSVESSWVWSGGSTTTRDTCTYCSSGWYQNDATTPTTWVTHWGDGLKAGSEKCDDANTNNGDGCNSSWTSVESSWVWSGGSTTARDTCTYCSSGWYQNDATTPTTWVTHWGDGLESRYRKMRRWKHHQRRWMSLWLFCCPVRMGLIRRYYYNHRFMHWMHAWLLSE